MEFWMINLSMFLILTLITLNLSSAIQITDLTISNTTRNSFAVTWGYQLNDYNASELLGFKLTVTTVYNTEVCDVEVPADQMEYSFTGVESGTSLLVCLAAQIAHIAPKPTVGDTTCRFATTLYDPWNPYAQAALFVGLALLLAFVLLMVYDFIRPRAPSRENQQKPAKDEMEMEHAPNWLSKSNDDLAENMH